MTRHMSGSCIFMHSRFLCLFILLSGISSLRDFSLSLSFCKSGDRRQASSQTDSESQRVTPPAQTDAFLKASFAQLASFFFFRQKQTRLLPISPLSRKTFCTYSSFISFIFLPPLASKPGTYGGGRAAVCHKRKNEKN